MFDDIESSRQPHSHNMQSEAGHTAHILYTSADLRGINKFAPTRSRTSLVILAPMKKTPLRANANGVLVWKTYLPLDGAPDSRRTDVGRRMQIWQHAGV